MDHETSLKTLAPEKYLLGELSPAEREEFEQHFFECPECADEVRLGFDFAESARIVFQEKAQAPRQPLPRNRLRDWLDSLRPLVLVPATACFMIGAFSVYQNVQLIPALRSRVETLEAPRVLASTVLAPASRSAIPTIVIPAGAPFFQLTLAIAARQPADSYQCELRNAADHVIASMPVSRLDPEANLDLLLPTAKLSDGQYEIVLSGVTQGTSTRLEDYHFAVSRSR
ncbi:MAG TPA: anti-sigma factor [Bryobacteraceae bacterium]|jgi:anti-sigma factor RsiW